MSARSTRLPEGVAYRRAGHADNSAILGFFAGEAMQAGMRLRFDRSPDFFALPDAHSPDNETWLLLEHGAIQAAASFVLRDGYINGAPEPVAYLSDLRVGHNRKIAGIWRERFHERMARLAADTGARYAYTAIIRENRLARTSILRHRHEGQLRFAHLRGYSNVSVIARKPRFRAPRFDVLVRRATQADSELLRKFLDEQSRRQPFGVVFDEKTWRRRLESWPDFRLEDFHLGFDPAGQLAGCVAPWDFSALKKIVIDGMPAGTTALRSAYNLLTPLTGRPRITGREGFRLPDISLSHLCVRERDPAVFSALLDDAYRRIAKTRRYATTSFCLYENDRLWPALDGYWHYAVPMDLYSVSLRSGDDELPAAVDQIPGFEIYLV